MKLSETLTDEATLAELGTRLAQRRLDRGLTQAALAEEAGVAKRTVERVEAGQSVQLVTLVRLCRVLELMENLDRLVPEFTPGPMALLRAQTTGRERRRAPGRRAAPDEPAHSGKGWIWGDES